MKQARASELVARAEYLGLARGTASGIRRDIQYLATIVPQVAGSDCDDQLRALDEAIGGICARLDRGSMETHKAAMPRREVRRWTGTR